MYHTVIIEAMGAVRFYIADDEALGNSPEGAHTDDTLEEAQRTKLHVQMNWDLEEGDLVGNLVL